ncbi:hypothetical protein ACVRXQ_02885 [Streptococcus panodentis]|uniref:Uncharacterized protein n=1 Tax=Streptococcus panodentis TaxID=1581472 RepID=A0ABS5AZU8_9STRE|nr:hypothetical protein [Streptococcus panodentis]MBP2621768.1 hypothetical protein [Streptococcus panodentis]
MKKRIKPILISVIILLSIVGAGIYMYNKITEPNLGPQTTKLYQRGFRLLEEQIGIYIKEHYSGIEKIEFSPIYVTGDDGSSMIDAYVRPTIYDKHGNQATLGTKIKRFTPSSYGLVADMILDYDGFGKEVIELMDSEDNYIDVSSEKHLPDEARLTSAIRTDDNIKLLVEDGQLKGVVKNEKGSPEAQIIYNVELEKGE